MKICLKIGIAILLLMACLKGEHKLFTDMLSPQSNLIERPFETNIRKAKNIFKIVKNILKLYSDLPIQLKRSQVWLKNGKEETLGLFLSHWIRSELTEIYDMAGQYVTYSEDRALKEEIESALFSFNLDFMFFTDIASENIPKRVIQMDKGKGSKENPIDHAEMGLVYTYRLWAEMQDNPSKFKLFKEIVRKIKKEIEALEIYFNNKILEKDTSSLIETSA